MLAQRRILKMMLLNPTSKSLPDMVEDLGTAPKEPPQSPKLGEA